MSRCNTHIFSNFLHPRLANPLPVEFWLRGVSRTPDLTCAKLPHFFRELPHHQRLRTVMTLDLREYSSRCDDGRCNRYFRTVGSPAHCSSVAYDCFHWHFCRAVRNGRLLPKLRKAASANNCAERQRSRRLHFCNRLWMASGSLCPHGCAQTRSAPTRSPGRWAAPIAATKGIALGAGLWARCGSAQ
jgi:hypothetical protein